MKVLFLMRHPGLVRNFESTLRLLAERGHRVHVGFDRQTFHPDGQASAIERLGDEHAGVTSGATPERDNDPWFLLARQLRHSVDYLRYLEPAYHDAPKLRMRAERGAPLAVRTLARRAEQLPGRLPALARALRVAERAIPASPSAVEHLARQEPDVVLVSPLVELGAPQGDYVRAARALGLPVGLCVASWDNLTNKGVIAELPDAVYVWNEAQRREAVELHGVPSERVIATGAQSYDHWFDWVPSTRREEFAARVGLRPDRPFLLYLCSSGFIASEETRFVARWLHQLRERPEPELREAGVLIRPHPQNAAQWNGANLSGLGDVAVYPPAGADPVDASSRTDYYDSIYHSAAVVGINTSALIESGIVGRRVHTLLAPEFRDTQAGTLHFAHLTGQGLLTVADNFEQHARQLVRALGAEDGAEINRAFLESFVRPAGLDVPATPRLVDAIEELARRGPAEPYAPPRYGPYLRPLLVPLAYAAWARDRYATLLRRLIHRTVRVRGVRFLADRYLVPLLQEVSGALEDRRLAEQRTPGGDGPLPHAETASDGHRARTEKLVA